MAKRVTYTANFKFKVAMAAAKENKTLSQIAQEFKIHTSQITKWKSQLSQEGSQIFEDERKKKSNPEIDVELLYAQIGKLQTQIEFLKKKTGVE